MFDKFDKFDFFDKDKDKDKEKPKDKERGSREEKRDVKKEEKIEEADKRGKKETKRDMKKEEKKDEKKEDKKDDKKEKKDDKKDKKGDDGDSKDRSDEEKGERKRDKFNDFVSKNVSKGEMAIKHAVGLGQTDNVVPVTKPKFKDKARPVEVGWHPVGGVAGKWFAEDTGLGKMITERINKYPDPTQHWAVLVGDYAHELWMDENFHVIYINEKIKREEWRTFSVGETRFNDDAIRRAGESTIQTIRDRQPAYNLITNNCQTYALELLDAIKAGGDNEFGTTLAIYERMLGPGKIKDFFLEEEAEEAAKPPEEKPKPSKNAWTNTVSFAQQIMNDNTTQLDTKEEAKKHDKEKEKKGNILSMFSKK